MIKKLLTSTVTIGNENLNLNFLQLGVTIQQ